MSEEVADVLPSVAEFFQGKTIFLSGATGFVGKVFIEKLLRSCPEIKAIYGLIRPQKGKSAEERLHAMLQEQCFDKLRSQQSDFETKVHAIHGDILEERLGISDENRALLEQTVDIVVHSAATVRFTDHLRLAVRMNVVGTRAIIQLCGGFARLEALVHVSTAYANCDRDVIEEKLYPSTVHPQKVIDIVEWMDDDMLEMLTPKILGGLPNTYTFTKKLAEQLLLEEAGGRLPLCVVRPSIVTAAHREPVTGWIDNLNGASGVYVAYSKGLMQTFKCKPDMVADLIPVDFCVNAIITAAWHTANVHKPLLTRRSPLIFNLTSGGLNPCTWGDMEGILHDYFKRFPPTACFRRPARRMLTKNGALHNYWLLVSHLIPAFCMDAVYRVLGRKPRMVRIYTKLHKSMEALNYFVEHTWTWPHHNMDELRARLSPEDRRQYYTDPRDIEWTQYIENFCGGTKTYLLKEDPSSLPAARAHIRKLRNIRYVFNTVGLLVLWRLLIARSSLARNSWYLFIGLLYKFVQFFKISSTLRT